jgi:hypothetical protein
VECDNFRYQIYFRQEDLETAQFLATRCGSKSGFAHSKTEHEGSVSTGESEQKIPLITAQYIMYDMPDDEILGFWGKRPFIGKGFPHPTVHQDRQSLKLPALSPVGEPSPEMSQLQTEPHISWREDPALLRRWNPPPAADAVGEIDGKPLS